MKLACVNYMVPGRTLTEKALKMKKWGFDGISIFAKPEEWSEDYHAEIKLLPERTGIAPCEFVLLDPLYGRLMDRDHEVRQKAIEVYKKSIRIAGTFNAVSEMEYEYRAQDPLPLFDPYPAMPEDKKKEFLPIMQTLAQTAGENGALILLEPCNRYETKYLTRLQDIVPLLKTLSHPSLGILADFFHLAMEEADIPGALRQAGQWIRHIHLGDNNRLLPGCGHTDFKSAFRVLKDTGFQGYMSLECGLTGDPEKVLPQCVEFLRKQMQA